MDAGRGRADGIAVQLCRSRSAGRQGVILSRTIRGLVNEALAALSGEFSAMYARRGRPSIPPRSCCARCCCRRSYSIRSEQAADRNDWSSTCCFAGSSGSAWMTRPGTTRRFPRTATACWRGEIAAKFMTAVLDRPRAEASASTDHFSVDGTLVEAWALMKASSRKMDRTNLRSLMAAAMQKPISTDRSARTRRTLRRRTRTPSCTARAQGKEAKLSLHGSRPDGKPQRPGGRRLPDRSQRPRGAYRGAAHDRAARRPADADHARRRQGLRHAGFRQIELRLDERHAACGAEHEWADLGHRRSHDPSCRLRRKPAHSQADRGGLGCGQDGGGAGENEVPRSRTGRLGLRLRRSRIQPRGCPSFWRPHERHYEAAA